jgi:HSP20 family protein
MLARWNDLGFGDIDRSLSAFGDLRREMDRLLEAFDRDSRVGEYLRPAIGRMIRVNLHDGGDELLLRAELPGFTDRDINVTIEQGSLTIRGERQEELPEGYSVHRQERGAMKFARSFTLPSLVDTQKVEATLTDGILQLKMPKAEEARPREIEIKAS